MKLKLKTLAIALAFTPFVAMADMHGGSAGAGAGGNMMSPPTCDVTSGSAADKVKCVHQQLQYYAGQTKNHYNMLVKVIPAADRSALQSAHQAWAGYVNKECKFMAMSTMDKQQQPVVEGTCMVNMLKDRIKALQNYQTEFKK